jgi:hypothetical protein
MGMLGEGERSAREPCLPLQYKGDEPFCALHIFLIRLAQMRLQDVLFHMDTVAQANQHTPHQDQQTQPVRRVEPKPEQDDEQAGIGGMTNESIGTRFDHGLLGCDGHCRREESTEHVDGVETERDPRVDEQDAQPEEKYASARDGGGRNRKRQQRAEEDAEYDQANEERMRSFILALSASTEAFMRSDIHARFHHSPDEKADQLCSKWPKDALSQRPTSQFLFWCSTVSRRNTRREQT